MNRIANPILHELDRPRTLKEAAAILGIPYFKIQRAVKNGMLPSYKLFNGRKYVILRDILNVMNTPNKFASE